MCTNTEIRKFYDSIPVNSLTLSGGYIPTCTSPEEKCDIKKNFDFSNAFTGDIYFNGGTFNFKEFGQSIRQQLNISDSDGLYKYKNSTSGVSYMNPTPGSIWCACQREDGGLKKF